MKARNAHIRLEDMDLKTLEQEAMARAKEILGGIPHWYLENKENIEQNRADSRALTEECLARLEKMMHLCRAVGGKEFSS